MQKPVLGRGLKTLLRGDKIAGTETETPAQPTVETPGPGVQSLLRGSSDKNPFTPAKAPPKPLIPRAYFFAADIVLIALALLIAFRNPGPMSGKETFFCVLVIILACGCGLAGLMTGRKQ